MPDRTAINEPVDFCRVKKIDEKGYGFLKSLHYRNDVFFHFSQIKREELLAKLSKLKRGDFFLFFTSKERPDGKRKVDNIWYEVKEIPVEKIPGVVDVLLREFEEGVTNLYDLLFVFGELKQLGYIFPHMVEKVLSSKKILNLPTTILPYLSADEFKLLFDHLDMEGLKESPKKPFWYDEMVKKAAEFGG